MTINQLLMHNLAPRGIKATCVPTSICFVTGASYYDVEEILLREQPKSYRPDIQGNRGVQTAILLGSARTLLGHKFTRVRDYQPFNQETIGDFKRLNPTGTFLVCIPRHAFVIKDGAAFDLIDTNWRAQLAHAWRVEKV